MKVEKHILIIILLMSSFIFCAATMPVNAGSDEKTKAGYIVVKEPTSIEYKTNTAEESTSSSNTDETSERESQTPTDSSTENPLSWRAMLNKIYPETDSSTENPLSWRAMLNKTRPGTNTEEKPVAKSEISAGKSVSLSYLQLAAKSDPGRPQGGTTPGASYFVKIVEAALAEEGLLNDKYAYDGSYGNATIKAYKKWQKSIGSAEKYCDGIPGKKDLTKLGDKYGFAVDTSTSLDFDLNEVQTPTRTSSEPGKNAVTIKATNNAGSNKETIPKYTKVTKDNQHPSSKPLSASKVDTSAKVYSEPDITNITANLDNSGEYINVGYKLDSDFYSDDSTGTYFSIGYKFANEELNRMYGMSQNQFVRINEQKGYHWVSLPYPGIVAKVNIQTHYRGYGGGIDHYETKKTIIGAPIGTTCAPVYKVTSRDVYGQKAGKASQTFVMGSMVAGIPVSVLTSLLIDTALETLDSGEWVPSLKKGQMIQVNTTCTNDYMSQHIKVWEDEESYKKYPLEPMYNLRNVSVPVY